MKNDWIIANINNPDFTAADFKNIGGFSLENTQLLPEEQYLKSDKILENPMFQNEQGQFSKSKFTDYYNKQAEKFGNFQEDSSLDNYQYGFWDVFQKPSSQVRNPDFTIDKVSNPTHQSTGVIGINLQGERTKSDFELAEKQKIFDWDKGKFTDESPEDSTLIGNTFNFFKNIFSEPLVLAKYEEDTDELNPLTGVVEHHEKGENKLNQDGEYYFETLGGRSLVGRDVLSVWDTLTKEDSAVNKYDFFDSDDLEKSVSGVIAKNLTAIAPMVFLGPVGTSVYGGIFVARELLKTLPMLERIGTVLSSEDGEENSMLNKLAAYGEKFTGGTSDYGKSKTFSFENFGNLVSDVALQWGQQKAIAEAMLKLSTDNKNLMKLAEGKALSLYQKESRNVLNQAYSGKLALDQAQELTGLKTLDDIGEIISSGNWRNTLIGSKAIEQSLSVVRDSYAKKQKLGQDLSLIYMSMISNTDVYESAIEHGATKQEAAILALGSMAGMFAVDKYLGLGEMFFDDAAAQQRRLYRQVLKEHYDNDVAPIVSSMATSTQAETKKGILNFFKLGKEKTINFLKDYHTDIKDRTLGIVGKSIGEGLEETAEELNTDLWKSLYELAGQFGYATQTDIGAWDNAFERYAMSFLGGTIGGGIFGGIEAIKNPKTVADTNSKEALLTIVRQEGSSKIIKELDRMRDEGKLGSKELSINTQEISGENGSKQKIFLKADENNISQNDFNYNQMKSAIQQMDKIINGNQLNISDDKLFERMITSDIRLESLKDYLKDASYISGYYQDFQKLVNDIYDNESKIEDLKNTTDPNKRTDTYEEDLQKLLDKRDILNQRKEDFFKNKTQRYLEKTMFAVNTAISGLFLPVNFEDYVQKEYGKPLRFLSENDKKEAKEKYDVWVKTKKIEDLDKAFDTFKEISDKIIPVLQELSQTDIEGWEKLRRAIAQNLPDFSPGGISYDSRIEYKKVNVEEALENLDVIKGEEYDRPQKSDPTKTNKAFRLSLKEDPSLYFELIRDVNPETGEENGEWSIHFKTGNGLPTHTNLTESQKSRLFEAASIVLPEGARLSTWGSLTKGGISGLNRFGGFRGFKKVGERSVILESGQRQVPIELDESLIPNLETIKSEGSKEIKLPILRGKDGSIQDVILNYFIDADENIEISIDNNNEAFLISKQLIPSDSALRDNFDFNTIEDFGEVERIYRRNGEWYTEVSYKSKNGDLESSETFKGILVPELVPESLKGDSQSALTLGTTYNTEEEISIPIWEKNTGETQEEYDQRNTQLEGETPEEFEQRKKNREKLLLEQQADFIIDSIQNLLNNNTVIDANTFRYIIANLSARVKDIKKSFTNYIQSKKNPQIKERLQDALKILNDDLSNTDDVWNQIEAKILEFTNEQFANSPEYSGLSRVSVYEGLKNHNGYITFQDLVDFIEANYDDEQINLEEISQHENQAGLVSDEHLNIHYLVDIDLNESREALAAVDLVNIRKALENNETVILHNGYTITYDKGDGELITINVNPGQELDLTQGIAVENALKAILKDIQEDYKPNYNIGYSEDVFNKQLEENKKDVKESFDNVIGIMRRDSRYKILLELQKKMQVTDSPILKLLNAITSKLGENFGTIESTLQTIYEQYDNLVEASDFTLNESQIEALEKAKMLLDFAVASIVAASGEDSYQSPWAYNKTINQWNREHRSEINGEIKDLPEIDQNLANVSLSSILQYQAEIDSWIKKARGNRINKVKMFKEFEVHFEQVKLKFFMDNKEKWITEDGVNLLDGVQEKSNPKDQVLEYERTLYKNVQNLLKEGKNVEYIFDAFRDSINWSLAATQKTSKLDLNLQELSDYDKFVYIVSLMALNPDNFYTEYKKFVEQNKSTIAPLSFQKHNIRILKAHENNKNLFNQFLELFKKETGLEDCPILENTIISTGIGGSGKTSVCAKAIVNKNTWVCGPTETQTTNLKELAPNLKDYLVKDLLKLILEDQYDGTSIKKDLITEKDKKGDGGRADISKLTIKPFSNPPSNIVLDETTLVSNAELQVIAKWCEINNVQLILVGDENQNGNSNPGNNIARETTIAIRTPKMQLSLREGNLWKYQNQQTLMNLEDQLRDTDTKEETQVVKNRLINTDLKKFGLKYYFKDGVLSGDMISSTLTDEQLNALPNGKVKFIGTQSSPIYQKLKAGGKLAVEKAYSLDEIQGQESDYIVCDIDWTNLTKFADAFKLLNFMRSLYTVITRSRVGSIIIDNGLSSVIKEGGSPQSYSTDSVMIDKEAIKSFSDFELNWLNSLTLNPDSGVSEVNRGLNDDTVIEPIIEEIKDDGKNNLREVETDDSIIPNDISELPIQVYTNFNYLGINRNADGVWYNESDSHRDVGIFLRQGVEISENKDKRKYADLLFDLKSFIVYNDIELYNSNASSELKKHFTKKNLQNIKYFVVKEKNNLQTHHLISEEQGLTELPEGEEIITLQARLKDKNGNDCIITLGVLPKSTNLHEEITIDALTKRINKLNETPGNEDEISKLEGIIVQLENGSAAREYQKKLDEEIKLNTETGEYELEIDKPDFTQICGLSKVRGVNKEGKTSYFRVRLSEIALNSKGEITGKSRFNARTSNYVVSPIYASMDKNDPLRGKPCIFVSSRRIYDPEELADRYEENLANGLPSDVRKIMLDPLGVSFESLFDDRYAQTLISEKKIGKNYTFPFELLPMGVRMYTALHNFRANLRRFNQAVKNTFGDEPKDLVILEKQLKEESRLFNLYKDANKPSNDEEWIPNEIEFRNWVQSNVSEISNDVTLDDIKKIWDFNDNTLKDVKQFRLGYNEKQGVYVRNISNNYLGNYINPQVAKQYLGTVEKIFELVLDQIIPKNSINPNDLVDYRVTQKEFEKIEENWVKNIKNASTVLLNVVDTDEDGNSTGVIPITIEHKDKLRAIPILLTMITKNLQARQRMNNPDEVFEGYDNLENKSDYLLTLGNVPISYLKILDGGLGDIRKGRDIEPGVIKLEGKQKNSDLRLLNMFNVCFHGTVATGGNDFTKPVSQIHAKDVLFPHGIYVDPITTGKLDRNRKYRKIGTNSKYYSTNVAPSGAKTFIKLSKKSSTTGPSSNSNKPNQQDKLVELHTTLNKIVGREIDLEGNATSAQMLVDNANKMIAINLSEQHFTYSGKFDTPEELLNLTISITLNPNGTITENKLKDFEEIKNVSNFEHIKQENENYILTTSDGISYTISYNGGVKVKRNVQNEQGKFVWSVKDAIKALSNLNLLSNENTIINQLNSATDKKYESQEAFKQGLKTFLNDLKEKDINAFNELIEDLEIEDDLSNIDTIIEKLEKMC